MSGIAFGRTSNTLVIAPKTLASFLETRARRTGPWSIAAGISEPVAVFEEGAWMALLSAARSEVQREQIGVLHGRTYHDGSTPWILVRHALHAKAATASRAHAELDAEAWAALHKEVHKKALDLAEDPIVGWWHTHPDLGAFYSDTDRSTQAKAFPLPQHFGLVLDPVRGELAGFFGFDSKPAALPTVVGPEGSVEPIPAPALALCLPIASAAKELCAGAWQTLCAARRGAVYEPWPADPSSAAPRLVFDRPALKHRHPTAREALASSAARADGSYELALPVAPTDVVGILYAGELRPANEFLTGHYGL